MLFCIDFPSLPKSYLFLINARKYKIKKYLLRNLCYKLLTLQNYHYYFLKNTPKKGDFLKFIAVYRFKQILSLGNRSSLPSPVLVSFFCPKLELVLLFSSLAVVVKLNSLP